MIHEPQRRPGSAGTAAHAGVSFGSDRLPGPFFPLRLEVPDKSSGGSRPGAQPKGVQLPGLQAARQQQGLSQAELAALAGVNEKTISRLERGGRAYYVTLERLAQALRVSRQRLLRPPP
jgi:DNA-binding Xre family transcriptional regulator